MHRVSLLQDLHGTEHLQLARALDISIENQHQAIYLQQLRTYLHESEKGCLDLQNIALYWYYVTIGHLKRVSWSAKLVAASLPFYADMAERPCYLHYGSRYG